MFDPSLIRSLLFVPGDSRRKLERSKSAVADALIIDWEDAVLPRHKQDARAATIGALGAGADYPQQIVIRVNPASGNLFEADCDALADCAVDGVMLPKGQAPDDVHQLAARLAADIAIIPVIESPLAVISAAAIASCSERVKAFMFGAEDYSVEMGIERSTDEVELLYARGATVNAARAHSLEVFDSPPMDYRDLEAARESSLRGRRMGFGGRAAIHPNQLPVINAAYTPTTEQAAMAQGLLDQFEAGDSGAIGIEGKLIDEPILRQARRTVARYERFAG